jgi:hydroxymethylpyrimidine/phosphomethylpyrimidine kinase
MEGERNPRPPTAAPAVALTIAGSDCSAGAGLQADLKTFSALGVYGLTAVTCVVAEVPRKVSRIDGVDPRNVREQIELCLTNFPVCAIKTGLLFSRRLWRRWPMRSKNWRRKFHSWSIR